MTCEICNTTFEPSGPGRTNAAKACFDHNHGTGEFRGWLCGRCNKAIGLAGDNPEILRAAADYLESRGCSPTRQRQ